MGLLITGLARNFLFLENFQYGFGGRSEQMCAYVFSVVSLIYNRELYAHSLFTSLRKSYLRT